MLAEAHRAAVEIFTIVRLFGADSDTVCLQHATSTEPVPVEGGAATVLAQGHLPVDDLLHELDGRDGEVCTIGDCVAPCGVEEAAPEGLKVAAEL